jgi:hypothetical protein
VQKQQSGVTVSPPPHLGREGIREFEKVIF